MTAVRATKAAPQPRAVGVAAGLSRELVLAAAEAVIDARGIPAMSIRAVAAGLGVTPRALYHHFANKQDLLDAVADVFFTREVLDDLPEALPQSGLLRCLCLRLWQAGRAHPELAAGILGHVPARPDTAQLLVADTLLKLLEECGCQPKQADSVYRLLVAVCIGDALSDNNLSVSAQARVQEAMPSITTAYPRVARHITASLREDPQRRIQDHLDLILGPLGL